jgi:hypothetical protein
MEQLDSSRFVVLGEGLASGMTNFSLIEADQVDSFPAQMAHPNESRLRPAADPGPGPR